MKLEENFPLAATVSSIVSSYLMMTFGDDSYYTVKAFGTDKVSLLVSYVVPVEDSKQDEAELTNRILNELSSRADIGEVMNVFVNTLRWSGGKWYRGSIEDGVYDAVGLEAP